MGLQGRCGWVEDVWLSGAELYDRQLAVGGDDVAGCVGGGFGGVGAVDQRVGGSGAGVEEIGRASCRERV